MIEPPQSQFEAWPHDADRVLAFTLTDRDARGRVVRLGPTLDTILQCHRDPPGFQRVLAEALVLTALLGSLLKEEGGQVTLQAPSENGVVRLLVCDWLDGALRGYIQYDRDAAASLPDNPDLSTLFGTGYLAITFDRLAGDGAAGDHRKAKGERYQGIVPLEGDTLAHAVENYFCQSEQLPSRLSIAVEQKAGQWRAGGMLLQPLARAEAGSERIAARDPAADDHWQTITVLADTVKPEELLAEDLPLSDLIWRLFHDEGVIRLAEPVAITRGCRCDPDHIRSVLARFAPDERSEMVDESGAILVDCAFCAHQFRIDPEELSAGNS